MGISLNWSAKFQKPSPGNFKNTKVFIGFPDFLRISAFRMWPYQPVFSFKQKCFPQKTRPKPSFQQVTRRPAAVKVTKRFTAPQWLRSYSWPKANMAKPWLKPTGGLMVWPVVWPWKTKKPNTPPFQLMVVERIFRNQKDYSGPWN